jgi:hypothetical protein
VLDAPRAEDRMTQPNQTCEPIGVTLAMSNGPLLIKAYRTVPGLAVHRFTFLNGDQAKDWTITHIESGRRVVGEFPTRGKAFEAVEKLSHLADWTQPMGSKEFDKPDLGKLVQAIRDEIGFKRSASYGRPYR